MAPFVMVLKRVTYWARATVAPSSTMKGAAAPAHLRRRRRKVSPTHARRCRSPALALLGCRGSTVKIRAPVFPPIDPAGTPGRTAFAAALHSSMTSSNLVYLLHATRLPTRHRRCVRRGDPNSITLPGRLHPRSEFCQELLHGDQQGASRHPRLPGKQGSAGAHRRRQISRLPRIEARVSNRG